MYFVKAYRCYLAPRFEKIKKHMMDVQDLVTWFNLSVTTFYYFDKFLNICNPAGT